MKLLCNYLQQSRRCLILIFFLSAPVIAWAQSQPPPQISVSGEGRVELAPDMAVVTLNVTREAETARQALDLNSAAMTQLLKAMRSRGIAERDLQTVNFSIQPRYAQVPRTASGERPAPRIERYSVRNGLTVKVRDLATLGEIIDQAVTLGVNEGGQVQFANADPGPAIEEARKQAVADALAKATTLAQAAGVKVGDILELSEFTGNSGPVPMATARVAMLRDAETVPVAAGENSYRVQVNLSVAIDQ